MFINEAVSAFLAYGRDERRFSRRTLTSYREELELFLRWCKQEQLAQVRGIEKDHIVKYLGPNGPAAGMAPATRNRKLTILRSFFRFVVEAGMIKESPAREVRFSRLPRREKPSFTRSNVAALLDTLNSEAPWRRARDRCVIALLFNTGLRLGELVALDIGQIDVDNGLVHSVRRKGGGEQPLPLNEAALTTVREWLAERALLAPEDPALFVGRWGRRLSPRSIQARLKELGARAGLPFIHAHALRHSFATELLATGANLEEVRRLMGHSSIVTTSRYSHPDQGALRRAVGRLGGRKNMK